MKRGQLAIVMAFIPGCLVTTGSSYPRGGYVAPAQPATVSAEPAQSGATVAPPAQPGAVVAPPAQPGAVVAPPAQPAAPAVTYTTLQNPCVQGTRDQCNGMDDNCNGVIDEGCGYQSGAVQITLGWDSRADLDLYVTDPRGEELYEGHSGRRTGSGAVMDKIVGHVCDENGATGTENIYWPTSPPSGTYRVRVRATAMCGAPSTTGTLSVAANGRILGVYRFTFTDRGEVELPQFTIP